MTLASMTGFAAVEGALGATAWRWELRSVNARGLDLRIRAPEGRERVEAAMREALKSRFARGAVTATLRVARAQGAAASAARLDPAALAAAAERLRAAADALAAAGLEVAPTPPEALLAMPGVLVQNGAPEADEAEALDAAMIRDGRAAVEALAAARAEEGARLAETIGDMIDRIAALSDRAEAAAAARAEAAGPMLRRKLSGVLEALDPCAAPDPQRLAAELAMLAVKGDVREELDRLRAHVAAARALLAADGPAGRRFDFLAQELNREANTLCAKADFHELTAAGLELKTVIDQLREQVQNVE
ncbi:YicC/YloC family endoribonuclease [Oceanicella actignis]|uniref:YicC/YloC family endoribonuclease n=1 Tax=Oceanicella actignis TaxID=1189325 RepID=UPI0011E6C82F|nr:YicC/YloC family endoribonuclease [Oceanicella actignis]TYO89449.1 uncharacterized protein (TIGR00255 family) [Oceanicella actignis]